MVRVVSDGPTVTKRVVCPNCSYELEYTGEDIVSFTDCDGDTFKHIFCPREKCKRERIQISVRWP